MIALEGGCLCGAIRYTADRAPLKSMICHCTSCRRSSGAPIVAWLTLPICDFTWSQGSPTIHRSSPKVDRTFCGTCGTSLTYAHCDRPEEIDVTTATLDDPDVFPPVHHSWLEDGVRWLRFGDGLPAHLRTSAEK